VSYSSLQENLELILSSLAFCFIWDPFSDLGQYRSSLSILSNNFFYAFCTGEAPLTAVQLLWVNLIMDTLGALALATEPPYDALMERPPVGRKGSFITNVMWRNIVGQAVYQLIVLWVLQFAGIELLQLGGRNENQILLQLWS
jgi:Ca2+-transporting ATPase